MSMYTIKIFSEAGVSDLQQSINEWLRRNKDILVHSSNLVMNMAETTLLKEYIFHILYTGPDNQEEQLKEMAAVVTQEQSIEVKEMNPEIMKPSS